MPEVAYNTQHLPRRLVPGQLIDGRYRLERVAGAGGMATVWRAHDERLGRPVALKVISDALAANPTAVARFAREARTHAGIQHPNLVQVYDHSIAAAQPYLVMEYVDGATLSERLDRGGISPDAIHTLAVELLSAIACVHDRGVLHRDIKCGNVLLDRDGHARLTDFGLARLEDATLITRTNEVVGTLRFLAPELIEGRPATRQSDLFALGVLLRTTVAQAAPDAQLAQLITWLTQHDPRARPADAHAALAFLTEPATVVQAAAAGRGGADAPTERLRGPQPRRPRSASRARNRAIAVCTLLAAGIGTAFTVLTVSGGATRATAPRTAPKVHTATGAGAPRGDRPPTVDERLQRLAAEVRAAARGNG